MNQVTTIDDLYKLSVRAYNSLKRSDITTLEQIGNLSDEEIKNLRFMNRRLFAEIKALQLDGDL